MGKKFEINWMGVTVVLLIAGIFTVLALAFGGAALAAVGLRSVEPETTTTTTAAPVIPPAANPAASSGGPVSTFNALQMNKYSGTTEGSNNLDFWDLGANVADTSRSARISVPFSSGSMSLSTGNVTGLFLTDNQATKDLYINGGASYYDDKIAQWHLITNPTSGVATLFQDSNVGVADPSGAAVASAVGTFANFTTAYKLDTGVTQAGEGFVNLSNTSTGSNPYVQLQFGNAGTNSEIRQPVLCVADLNSVMEGNEFTALTLTYVSGTNVGITTTNLLPLYTQAAGTGATVCQSFPDMKDFGVGVYQVNFQTNKGQFTPAENFQIIMDDLGNYKARQYPSANLKAATEKLTIQYTA